MLKRANRTSASWNPQNYVISFLMASLALILLLSIIFYVPSKKNPNALLGYSMKGWSNEKPEAKFHPTIAFRNGTDVMWQIPSSPKAALFLAHGCDGRSANFWDKSKNCPHCVGLPEERRLVIGALARKFAVITISSKGRCWMLGREKLIVKDILESWVMENKLQRLPLVAMGASSGGYFLSVLANEMRFSSIVLMIAEGLFEGIDIPERYPPTLFVHMPKDLIRQQKIREYMEVLESRRIDVAEVECMDLSLTPTFLSDRIQGLDPTVSAEIYKLLREKGFIDRNGYLKRDGRKTRWKEALRENNISLDDPSLVSYIQEELNLAYAYHEMTSVPAEEIFRWFESHMKRK